MSISIKLKLLTKKSFFFITGKFKNPNVLGKILLQLQVALAFLLPSYDIHVLAILRLQNLTRQFFETTGLLLQRLLGARVLV